MTFVGTCPAIKQCLSALGSQALTDLSQRGGSLGSSPFWLYTFVLHRLSNPPTHALYALGAFMSVPLPHMCEGLAPQSGQTLHNGEASTHNLINQSQSHQPSTFLGVVIKVKTYPILQTR